MLQVLEDAVRAVRLMSREKNITVHYDSVADEWPMEGDYGRLKQMFITVLDNAVKYSETGGNIWISAKNKANSYYVAIEDEGCGIQKEEQQHIFDKFYQIDSSHTAEGNGLGLALVKRVLDVCGGTIAVENLPQAGCRFTVTLPDNTTL